jgi:hypothetical protein
MVFSISTVIGFSLHERKNEQLKEGKVPPQTSQIAVPHNSLSV